MSKLRPANFVNNRKVRCGEIYGRHYLTKSALIGFIIVALIGFSFIACSTKEKATAGQSELTKMEDIKKQIAELTTEKNKLTGELSASQSKYLSFQVNGDIKDKSSDSVMLFGKAIPSNGDWSHEGATSSKSNIMVKAPKKDSFYASNFLATEVYYVGKTTGKNAFGASVPVLIFTTEAPSEVGSLKKKIEGISKNIEELETKAAQLYAQAKENVFNANKDNPQALLKDAEQSISKGEKEYALRSLQRVLELNQTNADAHVLMGNYYLKFDSNNLEIAEAEYKKATASDTNSSSAHFALGQFYFQQKNNLDLAAEEYKTTLSINPKHIEANKNYGIALLKGSKQDLLGSARALCEAWNIAKTNNQSTKDIEDLLETVKGYAQLKISFARDSKSSEGYNEKLAQITREIKPYEDEISRLQRSVDSERRSGYYKSSKADYLAEKKRKLEDKLQQKKAIEDKIAQAQTANKDDIEKAETVLKEVESIIAQATSPQPTPANK